MGVPHLVQRERLRRRGRQVRPRAPDGSAERGLGRLAQAEALFEKAERGARINKHRNLAPIMVERVLDRVSQLVRATGMTVLLVEQNVGEALAMSERAYVLERGMITRTGAGPALLGDPAIRRAYLGL